MPAGYFICPTLDELRGADASCTIEKLPPDARQSLSHCVGLAQLDARSVIAVIPDGSFPPDTDTLASNTVRPAWPDTPSLVAMTLTVPAASAVTTPVDEFTVATPLLLVLQTMERPVSVTPPASRSTAVAVTTPPAWTLLALNETLTDATADVAADAMVTIR
jgi:hypothetical protein